MITWKVFLGILIPPLGILYIYEYIDILEERIEKLEAVKNGN